MDQKKPNATGITVSVLATVLAVSGGVAVLNKKTTADALATDDELESTTAAPSATASASASATALSSTSAPTATATTTTTPTPSISAYKDGTYTATGSYSSPGGMEEIGVTITLVNGVVTASSVEEMADNRESEEFQSAFAASYKSRVVGKKIDEISLGKISGSSLTPKGFNAALATIKSQAKG